MKTSWIEEVCKKVEERGRPPYNCASGVSVSGILHPGKLRDIFIANQVYTALTKKHEEANLIYFVDDFDRFKKAPIGMERYEEFVGFPYFKIPSPTKESKSFVEYFFNEFFNSLRMLNIFPQLVFESERYLNGMYNEEIEIIYDNVPTVQKIIQEIRNKELNPANLFHVYCEQCGKDSPVQKKLISNKRINYQCSCGYEGDLSIFEPGKVKLSWIVNWSARWNKEATSFEPIGPDHASPKGCFEVSSEVYKKVFGKIPPIVKPYGFINLQGGAKLSSSKTKVSLTDMLEIYDPQVVEFIFSSKAPETFFEIDLEHPFEKYDEADKEKEAGLPSFKRILHTLRANLGEYPLPEKPQEGLINRVERAKRWAEIYSPIEKETNFLRNRRYRTLTPLEIQFREELIALLIKNPSEEEIEEEIFKMIKEKNLDKKGQFSSIYQDLFGKPSGPRLAKILFSADREELKKLILS
jgi:lysyl-tRNA synthetase class 1